MNIGIVSQLTGASPKAIRHYEAKGLLPHVQRQGTYRTYTPAEVNLVRLIRSAQTLGFKLSDLSALTHQGQALTWLSVRSLVDQRLEQLSRELARLEQQRLQLSELQNELHACIDPANDVVDLTNVECELLTSTAPLLRR